MGLNTSVNVRLLSDDEAFDTSNFSLDEVGAIKERDLFGQYNATAGILGSNYITGLFKFYTTNSKFFFTCAGTKIGLGSGGTFSDITPTNSTVILGSYYSGISFNNRFYLFNPKDEPFVYIGNGSFHKLGNASAIPGSNCAYSAIHKARVWAARSDTFPYRLYFSSLNNAEDWVITGGYIDLPDINQEIKGIISWGGYLYIFTETNIYVLLGSTPNDFSLRKTNSMVGTIAPRSIKITDVGICFLDRTGVYAFDGNNSSKLSTKIEGTISGISKTMIQNACALYDGRKYWLAYTLSGSSYNNRIIIYDIYLKDWVIYQGEACNISYFERAYGGTDKGELYGGSSVNNGIVYQLQAASGAESIVHSTETDFNNQVTFNSVVTTLPSIAIQDGNDWNTKGLFHFNGANGATTGFSDDYAKRVETFAGGGKLDSTYKMFGASSYSDNGGADYVTVPDSNDWNFGMGDFTIELRVRFTNVTDYRHFITQYDGANLWYFRLDTTGKLAFTSSGGQGDFITTNVYPFVVNQWYHIVVERSGTNCYMFVDGVSLPITQVTAWGAIPDVTSTLRIGAPGDDWVANYYVRGNIDEVRITKGLARWTSNFTPVKFEYNSSLSSGTLTSQNLQINALGLTTLSNLSWLGNFPTNTKVAFQTRTGPTNDTVTYANWQAWTSNNTVTVNTVTNATVEWNTSDTTNFKLGKPVYVQTRNIPNYEDEDKISPNCVTFNTTGIYSKGQFAWSSIAKKDISTYDWIGVWYKSPQTGNTVEFSLGETLATENTITFNTVQANTWEKAYWYIGGISTTARDGITKVGIQYRGDAAGAIVLGETSAYNFSSSGDVMSSTPNDWIQYRGVLGSTDYQVIPEIYSISLVYTPALLVSESSLSSYYYTKWFDFKTPQLNKQFDSMALECNSTTSSSVTIYCDYDIDAGIRTGTLSFPITSTANTVRMFKNFPSNLSGKTMRLKLYNNDKNAQVTIKTCEIRYRQEEATPN